MKVILIDEEKRKEISKKLELWDAGMSGDVKALMELGEMLLGQSDYKAKKERKNEQIQ